MDAMQVATNWAKAGMCDPEIALRLRSNYRALVLASMEVGGLNTIGSATKNNVSMAIAAGEKMGLSKGDTMEAMRIAIGWIDLGYVPCRSRSIARF